MYYKHVLYLVIVLAVSGICFGDIDHGLVGWWKLNGNSSDATPLGHDANLNGGLGYSSGVIEEGLDFDGVNDHATVGTDSVFNRPAFTLACWIRVEGGSGTDRVMISSKDITLGTPFNYYGYSLGISSENKLKYGFANQVMAGISAWSGVETTGTVASNSWTHVAVTHMGTDDYRIKMYVNGVEKRSVSGRRIIPNNVEPLRFGAVSDVFSSLGGFFNGKMDDVRVYARVLSEADIAELYNLGKPACCPTPAHNTWGPDVDGTLQWDDTGAQGYNVYLDTANPPSALLVENYQDTKIDPVAIDFGVEYFWRVDKITAAGIVQGPVWEFTHAGSAIYVNDNAMGRNNGTSWTNAFTDLQDALAFHRDGLDILVAEGVYKPSPGTDQTKSFALKSDTALYGGFPDSRTPRGRDPQAYPTVLSGNLCDCDEPGQWSYNIVDSHSTNASCVLDGFILEKARNGLDASKSSMKVVSCVFEDIHERALVANYQSALSITDCVFQNNRSVDAEDAIVRISGSTNLFNCIFANNDADDIIKLGGGGGGSVIRNCLFTTNNGRPINIEMDSHTIENCVFWDNSRGAIRFEENMHGTVVITNNILWNNGGSEIQAEGPFEIDHMPVIAYNIIEGGFPGTGNIDADPLFVDAPNGDYHLKSQAGRWDPAGEQWVMDDETSPAIDAGNPLQDFSKEPTPNGGRINLGLYANTAEASLSTVPIWKRSDINDDDKVDLGDLAAMAEDWLAGTESITK